MGTGTRFEKWDVGPQAAQAPVGTVNITLRNSIIFRVCMGI